MTAIEFQDVTKRFDRVRAAVDSLTLSVEEGEFLILVGPSGCGKTTALRMVAGLETVTSGSIRIGGRVVNELPPAERDIAMVFQNYALYPHMTVRENLAFPLRQRKVARKAALARVGEVARLLGIDDLLARRPAQLSGGQRQRVAIGRALVRRPRAFLMDEPLSNLDAKLRVQMRAELIALHQRLAVTTIYVTHDQTEAMTLGDRVVVLDRGVVQQVESPDRLYRNPANVFVAGFIGSPPTNFLRGTLADGRLLLGARAVELPVPLRAAEWRDGDVLVGVRPEDFVLEPETGPLAATVQIVERLGPEVLVHLRVDGDGTTEAPSTVVARFGPDFRASDGDTLRLGVNAERLRLFEPSDGTALLAA